MIIIKAISSQGKEHTFELFSSSRKNAVARLVKFLSFVGGDAMLRFIHLSEIETCNTRGCTSNTNLTLYFGAED